MLAKILAMGSCTVIGYQDFKERMVFWFCFPILGLVLGFLHYKNVTFSFFYIGVFVNSGIVSLVLMILYLYSKYVAKKVFLNNSLGLGDILFFYALGFGFPTITFIILFSNALIFSLLTYIIFKKKLSHENVPLAGLMSLFLFLVLTYSLVYNEPSLYAI